MNKKSGVLGVSGVSSDMRELLAACAAGNEKAILAEKMYYYRIKKYIGAYVLHWAVWILSCLLVV